MKNKKFVSKTIFWCRSSFRVGLFLALRQLKRTSKWTTTLIIFIMTLTFLNLVFVNGILVGLVAGSSDAYRHEYSGDLIIKNFESKDFISETSLLINTLNNYNEVVAVSSRIIAGGIIEANYKEKKDAYEKGERISVAISGINPIDENAVTGLQDMIIDGEYLEKNELNKILIGSNLLEEYSRDIPGDDSLSKVSVGDSVRIIINGVMSEVEIKGVIKSKIGEVGRRVYTTDSFLRKIIKRTNYDANEISVLLKKGVDPHLIKFSLQENGFEDNGNIQTWEESQGQFFKDISSTFSILGLMIGSIGIVVASITVFIVIYINAVTRRKFIGILKGIGICGNAIEISYVLQSIFYAVIGSGLGLLLLYGVIKPYVDKNPIDFPFSDGILVAPIEGTLIRVAILIGVTLLAGYLPARMIVNKNTLDSILGR